MKRKHLILIALALLALFMACKEVAVEERDKKIFLRAGDFADYGFNLKEPERYEKFKKTYFYDSTYEVEYEFETPDDEKENALYLLETVSFATRDSDARLSKSSEEIGLSYGLRISGIEVEKKEDFYSYGDSSSFYVLKKNGKPVGNYFTARVGKKNFSLLISGMYIEDVEVWRELVEPKLKAFSSYNS